MNLSTNRFLRVTLQPAPGNRLGRSTFLARHDVALTFMIGVAASLVAGAPCRAGGLVISVPDISASAGSSGSFLVLLTDTDPSGTPSAFSVAGDQFELTLSGPASITFTDVSTATTPVPYIYAVSTANTLDLPLWNPPNPFPTTDFTALDTGFIVPGGYPGFTTLNPGDVFALALVSYTVSPTAQGGTTDMIGFGEANTLLSDNNGAPIPFTTTGGSITVLSVPEPATGLMGLIAIAVGSSVLWVRRRTFCAHRPN